MIFFNKLNVYGTFCFQFCKLINVLNNVGSFGKENLLKSLSKGRIYVRDNVLKCAKMVVSSLWRQEVEIEYKTYHTFFLKILCIPPLPPFSCPLYLGSGHYLFFMFLWGGGTKIWVYRVKGGQNLSEQSWGGGKIWVSKVKGGQGAPPFFLNFHYGPPKNNVTVARKKKSGGILLFFLFYFFLNILKTHDFNKKNSALHMDDTWGGGQW